MVSGVEIFIIFFILLIVITGIILTIYFVWRNEQKKKIPPGNGGAGNGNGGAGTQLPPGTIIPPVTNKNPIPSTAIYISQNIQSTKYITQFKSPAFNNRDVVAPITITPDIPCNNFLFNPGLNSGVENALTWQGDGESILWAYDRTRATVNISKISDIPTTFGPTFLNWKYDDSRKTWCSTTNKNLCLTTFNVTDPPIGITSVVDNYSNTPAFQWINIPQSTSLGCKPST